MKLNKSEILIEPAGENGIFNARINESGSHMRTAWKPLKSGPILMLAEFLFKSSARIRKVKIVITYEPRTEVQPSKPWDR